MKATDRKDVFRELIAQTIVWLVPSGKKRCLKRSFRVTALMRAA
jgi:hypothetical protein